MSQVCAAAADHPARLRHPDVMAMCGDRARACIFELGLREAVPGQQPWRVSSFLSFTEEASVPSNLLLRFVQADQLGVRDQASRAHGYTDCRRVRPGRPMDPRDGDAC